LLERRRKERVSKAVNVAEFHADTIMWAWTSDDPQHLDPRNAALASLAVVDAVTQFNARTQDASLSARAGSVDSALWAI
jgi:hypothetical protein